MNILITICARGGSRGVPGKNIKELNGKPLIAYTIDIAKIFLSEFNGDIELSTDDDKILEIAEKFGLNTHYKRPQKLATDSAGKISAIKHLFEYKELKKNKRYDLILDLDVTSPLRTVSDLKLALEKLRSKDEALNIFSVNPAERNPYFNMVEERGDGFVDLVKKGKKIKARQDAPRVYDMNASFYFFKRSFFEQSYSTSVTHYSLAYIMPHICFDIDRPLDFKFMDFLLSKNLLDFEI
jgi:CMP-N-acetylneuraminic acid synthetase